MHTCSAELNESKGFDEIKRMVHAQDMVELYGDKGAMLSSATHYKINDTLSDILVYDKS